MNGGIIFLIIFLILAVIIVAAILIYRHNKSKEHDIRKLKNVLSYIEKYPPTSLNSKEVREFEDLSLEEQDKKLKNI